MDSLQIVFNNLADVKNINAQNLHAMPEENKNKVQLILWN